MSNPELDSETTAAINRIVVRDEREFALFIQRHRRLGYGRMMQIISHLWYQADPHGALTTGPTYYALPRRQRESAARQAETDPACQEGP